MSELRADLLSDDPTTRARTFETTLLAALGLDPLEVDLDRLASAYRWLSKELIDETDQPSSTLRSGDDAPFDERDLAAVFGLVYAARTFHTAHRLLGAYPPGPGGFVELGAGWGPFALRAALQRPLTVTLVDASGAALSRAARMFERCGLAAPRLVTEDVARHQPRDRLGGIAVPFLLNELAVRDEPEALRRQLERWMSSLGPRGRLYLVEPGTLRAARRLQQLRDQLPAGVHVHAPCTGAPACPLLERPSDWCHFTWRAAEGPLARAIADRAQRRWREQHVSFLVLAQEAAEPTQAYRVLDVRPHGRAKVVARTCGAQGLVPVTALRRHAAHARLSALEPGALIRVAEAESKGDGLRVEAADGIAVLQEL